MSICVTTVEVCDLVYSRGTAQGTMIVVMQLWQMIIVCIVLDKSIFGILLSYTCNGK
jgi:hypothetical protein